MNKAQREFIKKRASSMFDYEYADHGELERDLDYMIYKFGEIDPTPDPPEWEMVIVNKRTTSKFSIIQTGTKEVADKWLQDTLRALGSSNVDEYKRGEYLTTLLGMNYEIREKQ